MNTALNGTRLLQSALIILLLGIVITACDSDDNRLELDPFADNNGEIPPASEYSGPLFVLSHNYPDTMPAPPVNPPWKQVTGNGPITQENAGAYVQALKDYITDDMRTLILDYDNWNAEESGWYNQPWLGDIREATHGMYLGTDTPKELFDGTGLTVDLVDYVLVYYDDLGGYTLGRVWGDSALLPRLDDGQARFPEDTIIVKAAFSAVTPEQWPVLEGSAVWPIYIPPPNTDSEDPEIFDALFLQFDIIVKDSDAAPETTWVFSTLVYDKDAPGDPWDKMVPLGAMWGNDPDVNSAENPEAQLQETWINPDAPFYSRTQLGWGGRLSGPNDGAVQTSAVIDGVVTDTIAASSCMSCHSPAEYVQEAFLLPGPSDPPNTDNPTIADGNLVLFEPGSDEWFRWFQNRPGDIPFTEGTIPLDYDMVFSFKALPAWSEAISQIDEGRTRPYDGVEIILP